MEGSIVKRGKEAEEVGKGVWEEWEEGDQLKKLPPTREAFLYLEKRNRWPEAKK